MVEQQLFLHLLCLSTCWCKLGVPRLSKAGVPKTMECSCRKGSWIYQLPQLNLCPVFIWKPCWKMLWYFSSFSAVWKAEAVVELGTLQGTPIALSCNSVLTPVLQTLFLNFRLQETARLCHGRWKFPHTFEKGGGMNTSWMVLSLIHGMSVDSLSGWVSVHFCNVPSSAKISWTLLSLSCISLF